jgi:hypothetical protein
VEAVLKIGDCVILRSSGFGMAAGVLAVRIIP